MSGGALGALGAGLGAPALAALGAGGLVPGAGPLAMLNPQTAQQAAQINRQARRLYVGNIPPGVSDVRSLCHI